MAEVKEGPRPKPEASESQVQATEMERQPTAAEPPWYENPSAFIRRFGEEMDRAVDRFFDDYGMRMPRFLGRGRELLRREAGLIPADWSPRVDVLQAEGQFIIRADVPGLAKDDIKVELTDDRLTIRGERKQEKEEKQEGYSYRECSYGTFYRAIPLPEGIDTSQAVAEFRDGVLKITMPAPRLPEKQARRLEIGDGT